MKKAMLLLLVPGLLHAWDFTQEYESIPVSFNGIECQIPWTTGYNYCHPYFADIDSDGDIDFIMGADWKQILFCENVGDNQNYYFDYITNLFVDFPAPVAESQTSNRPILVDIDNDNDLDLFIGTYYSGTIWEGRLLYYQNIGDSLNYDFELVEENFQDIEYQGDEYPFFVDIDNDLDLDLFIGTGYDWTPTAGRLLYYENIGTTEEANMDSMTNYFMELDLGYYCIPSFTDIDNDGDYDMFLGDEDGRIHFYRNDGTPWLYDFTFVTDEYADVDVANIASPTFTDIDGDGDFDLFVGERSWGQDDRRGDINFYNNIGTPDSAVFELVTQNFLSVDIGKYPSPAYADIDNNGLIDMFIGDKDGNINYFANTGTESNPYFTFETETFEGIAANFQSRPTFGDLDRDGDLDLIAGRCSFNTGSLHLYRNDGTPETPDYILMNSQYLGAEYEWPAPKLVDLDGDLDLDLLVGYLDNQVAYFENIGNPAAPNFILISEDYLNTGYINNIFASVCTGDLDGDGDYDIIRGHPDDITTPETDAKLDFYRNIGSPTSPDFVLEEEHFAGVTVVNFAEPYLVDIDTDGDLDLFVGSSGGGVSFWRNNEVSAVSGRRQSAVSSFSLLPNYPNPFNAQTVIPFTLDRTLPVRIAVYNQLGQEVVTLVDERKNAGIHQAVWNAGAVSSGVYLVRLETREFCRTQKAILVK